MTTTQDIVQKLWNLCNVLRDDGVTYHQYVNELTYLLFLKMAEETGTEERIPKGSRWADLKARDGVELFEAYRQLLLDLGKADDPLVQQIYVNAQTSLKQPRNLATLIRSLDELDWFSAKEEGLGNMYEGLLEKNAGERKSGAGQYFTPRPLIEAMVRCVKPQPGEVIQDPAAGTGGFLITADKYISDHTHGFFDLDEQLQLFRERSAYVAMELVQDTHRLGLMNMLLHDIHADYHQGDALSPAGAALPRADVILANPPFGTSKGGGGPTRDDLTFPTSNKQLAFLQHIYRALKPGGRAAVVLPDNVLFESGVGADIRRDLMDKCRLHTILRLPTGIFYAQGVKTNVLFFERGSTDKDNTEEVWFFDMRTNMSSFGKRTPLTLAHFDEFMEKYGDDPSGRSERTPDEEEGRWRVYNRAEIAERDENLDVTWLRDDSVEHAGELPPPAELTTQIIQRLTMALELLEGLQNELEGR